jgi:hypothetical protein
MVIVVAMVNAGFASQMLFDLVNKITTKATLLPSEVYCALHDGYFRSQQYTTANTWYTDIKIQFMDAMDGIREDASFFKLPQQEIYATMDYYWVIFFVGQDTWIDEIEQWARAQLFIELDTTAVRAQRLQLLAENDLYSEHG